MALNKSKPCSEVCGFGIPYKFEQNNKFFDQHGNEVTDKGEPVPGGEAVDPAAVIEKKEKPVDDGSYKGIALGGTEEKPKIDIPESDGLDDLTKPELFAQFDLIEADKPPHPTPKADLVDMLRQALKEIAVEDASDPEGDE